MQEPSKSRRDAPATGDIDAATEAMVAAVIALMTARRLATTDEERRALDLAVKASLERLGCEDGLSIRFRDIVHRLEGLWDTLLTKPTSDGTGTLH